MPNSNDTLFKNSFDEYVWIENNNSAQLNKGELIGTVSDAYGEWIDQSEWINLDETLPLDIYRYHVPVDNRIDLYVNIAPFPGSHAVLLLSDGVTYNYGIYICDYNGGEVYSYIENNTFYIKRTTNTKVEEFEVPSGVKIVGIACSGENFDNNQLTLYECIKGSGIWEIIGISQEELTNYIENKKFKIEIVTELPPTEEAKENILYMIPTLSHDIFVGASLDSVEWHYNEGNRSPYYGQNTEVIYGFSYNIISFKEYGIVVNLPDDFDTRYLTTGNTVKFNYTDSNEPLTDFKIYGQKHCYDEFVFVNGEFERVGLEINYDNYATKKYVDEEIATFDFIKVVDNLDNVTNPLINRIYFVPKKSEDLKQDNDLFDEYIWVDKTIVPTIEKPYWEWITTKQLEIDLTNYVEKVDGKGLSTNDFTNAHKTKLDSIVTNDTPKTIEGDVIGALVSVNDVHPVEQNVEVKLSSKNLIPYPYATEKTRRGITFTPNADGTVTVNGQNDGTGTARLTFTHTNLALPAGTYTIHDGNDICYVTAMVTKADGTIKYHNNKTFTLDEGDIISSMWIQVVAANSDVVFDNVIVKPQLERSSTATTYTPYKETFEDVTVSAMGKNLFKPTSVYRVSGAILDEFSIQEDGSVKIVGSATSFNYALMPNPTLPAGTYTFKGTNTDKFLYYVFTLKNGVQTGWYNGTFTLNDGDTIQYIQVRNKSGVTGAFDDVINVQLEVGSTATEFEPYKEPVTYTANADGTVDNVRSIIPNMTITTDTIGVLVNAKYNKDINKTINLAPFCEEDRQIATIGDISNSELITIEDIDAICGSTISYVDLSEGEF